MPNRAFLLGFDQCEPTDQPGFYRLSCRAILLTDPAVQQTLQAIPNPFAFAVEFDFTLTPNQIQTAIRNALIENASAYGFTLTNGQTIIPDLIKV